MTRHIAKRTGDRALTFEGTLLATVATDSDSAHPDYSGTPGRYQTLYLYQTAGGRLVATWVRYTLWDGEKDVHDAAVCASAQDVYEFFEGGDLAAELLERAGIEFSEEVA